MKHRFPGTHRAVPPSETLALVGKRMAEFGITRLANVTGLDTIGIPVVMACRPGSHSLSVAQGKGFTLEAAKASALMESVESYFAERIAGPLLLDSYENLSRRLPVVDVERLPLRRNSPFHPRLRMLWIEASQWPHRTPIWVPYRSVHTSYTTDLEHDPHCFDQGSNGLASGNTFQEAFSHGLCEVVERDAAAHFNCNRAHREERKLNLDTVDDPCCRWLLDRFAAAQVSVAVWETTRQIGIPSFECAIGERGEGSRWASLPGGAGCHPSRAIALSRALTEAAQSRLTMIAGSRDDNYRHTYHSHGGELIEATLAELTNGTRDFREAPTFESSSFEEDIEWETRLLRDAGFDEIAYLELTSPADEFSVVRVIVPGLDPDTEDTLPVLRTNRFQESTA